MNTGSILNQVEIMTYSTLTALMSGFQRLRGIPQSIQPLNQSTQVLENPVGFENEFVHEHNLTKVWTSIKESVPPLFLWLVLGFAAGFLIGMVQPR
jgi:hypothetical protein